MGYAYLAWCAYPGQKMQRDRFWYHAMAGFAKAAGVALREIPKPLRGRRDEKISNTVKRGLARIENHRLPAAYEALRLVATEGWPDDRIASRKEARNAMLALYGRAIDPPQLLKVGVDPDMIDDKRDGRIDNIRRLVERESQPALALAVALLVSKARYGFGLVDVATNEAAATAVSELARAWAPRLKDRFGDRIIIPITLAPSIIAL